MSDLGSWIPSLAPWITIGIFVLLLLGWVARNGWSFHIPTILNVDINSGIAVVVAPDKKQRSLPEEVLLRVLNGI